MPEPRLLLIRHGETEWSRTRRHTGRTDAPLDETGRAAAAALGPRLRAAGFPPDGFAAVWVSPLSRARDTAAFAGLTATRVDDDLLEWDYGAAEGRTTEDLRVDRPGWDVWDDGVVDLGGGGETVDEVGVRCDRVIADARQIDGTVAIVAHAHLLRILTARWLGFAAVEGRHFVLDPAGWAVLAWERTTPVVERWNVPPT